MSSRCTHEEICMVRKELDDGLHRIALECDICGMEVDREFFDAHKWTYHVAHYTYYMRKEGSDE